MANKIINQLPVVLQTTALKNFFESTVEQLYSKASIISLKGYIGKQTGDDYGLTGSFIREATADRREYNLTPVVNNINNVSGESENLIFYDEFISTLGVYGVTTRNHNTLFGSNYQVFMPPIDVDKFINYQEYFWSLTGPSVITITATADNPIDIDTDVIGKTHYTSADGVSLRSGMVINFADNTFTIPANSASTAKHRAGVEYVVGGVGEGIYLTEKNISNSTQYGGSDATQKDYIVIQRGSPVGSAWSRVNHWYHRDNFIDAGDDLPEKQFRARRPILELDRRIQMFNVGERFLATVTVSAAVQQISDILGLTTATVDNYQLQNGDTVLFINESPEQREFIYQVQGVGSSITLTALGPAIVSGDVVVIDSGFSFQGLEYIYNGSDFVLGQTKIRTNQPPLFMLYDDSKNSLSDPGLYPQNNFSGNAIFGYKVGTGASDLELGFPLSYSAFKSVSEISFENFIQSQRVHYQPFGADTTISVPGVYYYRFADEDQYFSYWKDSPDRNQQKIITTHYVTQIELDDQQTVYDIGAIPNLSDTNQSGYDIQVKINGKTTTDFQYLHKGKIKFNSFIFDSGDIIDIQVDSAQGIVLKNDSRYDVALSWRSNPNNQEIELIAEPEYLPHFKRYLEEQPDFVGDALASNNFKDTGKDITFARDIVQTDQDLVLAAFLLDDQPHNLVDAIRFNAREYEKYRARLIREIENYLNLFNVTGLNAEYILERVLRNLISYSVGKDVFTETFVLPFGDNYLEQQFDLFAQNDNLCQPSDTSPESGLSDVAISLKDFLDIDKLENSLLVYLKRVNTLTLLTQGQDYEITSFNPIQITFTNSLDIDLGDIAVTRLYNQDRDSAQCPPTPSTMGLYPLYVPRVELDTSFTEPLAVIVGHDGSKTPLVGDLRDDILLEFEKRIYNTARKEFIDTRSLPVLNVFNIRAGAFRDTNFTTREYSDLLRNSFSNWVGSNNVDAVVNEFFDSENQFTWNYRGSADLPGHWRGWYEYYYDTVRPHIAPWEMLAFFQKPVWWDEEYGTDYSSNNRTMWQDLEKGIIRQGRRANVLNDQYLIDNTLSRPGLLSVLPVNRNAELLSPSQITSTGTTTKLEIWNNTRVNNTVVTDTIRDLTNPDGNNLPNGINVTYGTGTALRVLYDNDKLNPAAGFAGHFWDYDGSNSSFSVFSESWDGFVTTSIYVQNDNTGETFELYNYTFDNLTDSASLILESPVLLSDKVVGVTVTGEAILNPASDSSWNSESEWIYDRVYTGVPPESGTYVIEPRHAGLSEWDQTVHSPIAGWSFDGLPIYGPYGYAAYNADGSVNNADIVPIQSAFRIKNAIRATGPGGVHTGQFVQDYEIDAAKMGQPGYTGISGNAGLAKYNMRYGVTPDSPDVPVYFYVATVDQTGVPQFPYVFGGVSEADNNTYQGQYYTTPINQTQNNTGSVTTVGELVAIRSQLVVAASADQNAISRSWRFGDGAPVENAWKYSVGYPFAVAEALLLAKPGKFAAVFSDPTVITKPATERFKLVSTNSRLPWDYRSPVDFRIHGDLDPVTGETVINVGYTQFIKCWLAYQQLNVKTLFADNVRTLNIKLAHRMAGFTDSDTLIVRSDQFSVTGESNSLLIPQENLKVVIHSSPYKNRNYYSGVMIQKTSTGYKVRGFDKNFGYFIVQRPNKNGRTTLVQVGGEPADFVNWESGQSYVKDTIVSYLDSFYQAPTLVTSSETFISSLWSRLPSLPQKGAVRATLYLDSLPDTDRVDYETQFETHQEVAEFLAALGEYQTSLGYSFGDYDTEINEVRNWTHSVKQFLFWVSGNWENNNILELSPAARRIRFNSSTGMVAKINRTDKNQFALVDQDGRVIQPTECEIIRDGTSIEIIPPADAQIYGAMLFTKEIEHAAVFDNVTVFNDTIFNPVYNQKQTRMKIKGTLTANWNGTFTSEGFIIRNDELKPNLDNLAQSLGRYHELGFIPVEKQVYQTARSLFGYQERTYLNDLELDDDDQFEFYTGMLQNKGTTPSLNKIARSKNIVRGEMTIYDEWAVKAGEFGDLENDQSIELKLEKSDITQDPQLITLAFPEDTTGVISDIRVVDSKHQYFDTPVVEISAPTRQPAVQAKAQAVLANDGTLAAIQISEQGSGYPEPPRIQVIAGTVSVANVNTTFNQPTAQSTGYLPDDITGLALGNLIITDTLGNANVNINVSTAANVTELISIINNTASVNANITAGVISGPVIVGNNVETQNVLQLVGNDFSLIGDANTLTALKLIPGRYQPVQSYAIRAVANHPTKGTGATTESNIVVSVNGENVEPTSNWSFDPGSRQSTSFVISGSGANNVDINDAGTAVLRGNVIVPLATPLNANTTLIVANKYPLANVFVEGVELLNVGNNIRFILNTNSVTIFNVDTLPQGQIAVGANVFVIEQPTVTFQENYFGDIPGASLNIKTFTNDHIAIITGVKRIFEITPDIKGDEVILIDIDDTDRFLKRPLGVKEYNLWPTTSKVDFSGITDDRYVKIPNSGYVNSTDVNYRSFDVSSIAQMFDPELFIQPQANDVIHVAVSENRDWNVYNFTDTAANVCYIEQEDDDLTTYLFSDVSLYDFVDNNLIGSTNSTRYLDHYLVIKNAQLNQQFVVWVNEQTVQTQQVRFSNISSVSMTEVAVSDIAPASNTVISISDIQPGASSFSSASAEPGNAGVVVITAETFNMTDGDTVSFASKDSNLALHANTYTVSNVTAESFTVIEPGVMSAVDDANLVYTYYGKTKIISDNHALSAGQAVKIVAGTHYSGLYKVESATANSFIIDVPYTDTVTNTGNVLTDAVTISTTTDHGIPSTYAGKKIAVHNAVPNYYNQVYTVDSVTANTITVYGVFPFADQSNIQSANTVVTTLDHDAIKLNHSQIKIENINSLDGICASFNRTNEIVRGVVTSENNTIIGELSATGFNMAIPSLRKPRKQTGVLNSQIRGAIPYVTLTDEIDTDNLKVVGEILIDSSVEKKVGFNTDLLNRDQTPASRSTTSISGQSLGSVLNTDPFNQSSALDLRLTTPLSRTDSISLLKVVPDVQTATDPARINNNPKVLADVNDAVNNAGSPVFDQGVVATISKEAAPVQLPPQQPPRQVFLRETVHQNQEFVQQENTLNGQDDAWYYRIFSPGKISIVFDLGTEHSNINVYQSETRSSSGTLIASTDNSSQIRSATVLEKLTLQYGSTDVLETENSVYLVDYDVDNAGDVSGCGVLQLSVSPDSGTHVRVEVAHSNLNTYRYYIVYPATLGEIDAKQNFVASQPSYIKPYDGVTSTADLLVQDAPQSPIFSPVGSATTKKKITGSGNKTKLNFSKDQSFYHDFGGFSMSPQVGSEYMPSVFKKTVFINTADQATRFQDLGSDYVNSTSQRAGGTTIPLSGSISIPVSMAPTTLKSVDILNDPLRKLIPFSSKLFLFNYEPKRIDSVNYVVQPISAPVVGDSELDITTYSPLVGQIPATVPGSPSSSGIQLISKTAIIAADAPVDADNVSFATKPVLEITPRKRNSQGIFVSAGSPALATISKPTPSLTLSLEELGDVTPGDVLLINNTPVTLTDDPVESFNNIRKAAGSTFNTKITVKNAKPAIKISSVSNSPLVFADGAGGTSDKTEVLDYIAVADNIGNGYSVGDRLRVVGGITAEWSPRRSSYDILNKQNRAKRSSIPLPRPAKFLVTAVDENGGIVSMTILDRGVYSVFPSESEAGLPLEYDFVNTDTARTPKTNSADLGKYDSAGWYGEQDSETGEYGFGYRPLGNAGDGVGSGVRVNLTARTITDNLSGFGVNKGTATLDLNIPAVIEDISIPVHLADEFNSALLAAGYPPEDISFGVAQINSTVDVLVLDAPVYDGVFLSEHTPGILKKLGLPAGDINADRTAITASNATPLNDYNNELSDLQSGVADDTVKFNKASDGGKRYPDAVPVEVACFYTVTSVGNTTTPGINAQDAVSVFGTSDTNFITGLFQYELRTISGDIVTSEQATQDVKVLYLDSLRYNTDQGITVSEYPKLWVDNYAGSGWAYLEHGEVKRSQSALVDPKFVINAIIYDSTTGEKNFDYDTWDPFKGVLPAFVDAEIEYFSAADPVAYNKARTRFGRKNVGQVWWDLSTVRYTWYEQGSNRDRWLNWGKAFPGSTITLYEWVESPVPPLEYTGSGSPKNGSDFVIERHTDPVTQEFRNYYYFWVQNLEELSSQAVLNTGRKFNTLTLARYISDPVTQGINTISYISTDSFVMANLSKTLREDEQHIQINLSRDLNPTGEKHTSWKLIREADLSSQIPEDLVLKMIDSLTEVDSAGNPVPAANLSDVERYGISFRPRQTMFDKPAEARRVLQYVLNELLADIKLNTLNPGWERFLPSRQYVETVDWYAVRRVDADTNQVIRFDSTSKAVFTVSSVRELNTLNQNNLSDGTIVMVKASERDRYQLWRWCCRSLGFVQIAVEKETVRLRNTVFTDEINPVLQTELRALLFVLKDILFVGTANINKIFFSLMKYALGEQQELDWAFKTSYIYVEKAEQDLDQPIGFRPSNFESVLEYLNEVKPYSAKIREYKDGKSPPVEFISDQMVSDYDLPPYADPDRAEVRILDINNFVDQQIMSTSGDHVRAFSGYTDGQTSWDTANVPVRLGSIQIVFDRVDWRLLENNFNAATTSYVTSIANNIANLNLANTEIVSNISSHQYSMSSRIFKFDPEVRAQFAKDISTYRDPVTGELLVTDTGNAAQLETAISAGALNPTLFMVKLKVGGEWNGDTLDANVFTKVLDGTDGLAVQCAYGYDTSDWDNSAGFGSNWDEIIKVENYEGVFTGNSTYRESGITYDGFDGFSFKRLQYGEERPEELVYLDPLETLIIRVRTEPDILANGVVVASVGITEPVSNIDTSANVTTLNYAAPVLNTLTLNTVVTLTGSANNVIDGDYTITSTNVSNNSFTITPLLDQSDIDEAGNITLSFGSQEKAPVEYLVHHDLYGQTEYLRILTDSSTSTQLTADFNVQDDRISVTDASVLPQPKPGVPGAIWIDSTERVEYRQIVGNTLQDITRGTRGTTVPDIHPRDSRVISAAATEVFDKPTLQGGSFGFEFRNPETAVWINTNIQCFGLTDFQNRNNVNTITAFLHNDASGATGWGSFLWDLDVDGDGAGDHPWGG